MTVKRILHASDFSPASRPAFRLGQDLAKALKAELILFHAVSPIAPMMGEGYIPTSLVEELRAQTRRDGERRLEALARTARRGRIRVSTLLAEGPAAEAIVKAAKRKRAGLIVIGTRGRTGLARMLLGSVAERVVRTATCPVLTVGARRA